MQEIALHLQEQHRQGGSFSGGQAEQIHEDTQQSQNNVHLCVQSRHGPAWTHGQCWRSYCLMLTYDLDLNVLRSLHEEGMSEMLELYANGIMES